MDKNMDEKFSVFIRGLRSLNNETSDISFHYGVSLESVNSLFEIMSQMWHDLREIEEELLDNDREEVKEEEGE